MTNTNEEGRTDRELKLPHLAKRKALSQAKWSLVVGGKGFDRKFDKIMTDISSNGGSIGEGAGDAAGEGFAV